MKELLDKLLSGEGKLSLLLLQAKVYAEQANDENLTEFIDKELNGYSAKELPEYRKIRSEIVGDIQDAYGQLENIEHPLDFSVLSENMGFDLSITFIPDGIGFIEEGLNSTDGQMVLRPLHPKMVKMLNETFHYNNPHLKLVKAAHRVGRAAIQYILTKVRQDLIIGLQRINKENVTEIREVEDYSKDSSSDKKSVFVTYAWENEEHNDKVISFVNFLREKGYDASMDKKESQEQSATDFNQMMLNGLQNAEKVVVILSKKYKERADNFKGGVGFEYKVILEQLKKHTNKFIFVSFGLDEHKNIAPVGLGGRDVLNLKKDQDESNFNNLFAKIESENIINFSEVSDTKVGVVKKEIKPFKL
jgi:hypothetical protein